jgi:ectoine hydroxylase-related dioxygenase (phytanoyl-CoA dioxygenase family)
MDRGSEWVKPNMDPGDFILWDSRTVHYGAAPLGNNKRMAICKYFHIYYVVSKADIGQTPATSPSSS